MALNPNGGCVTPNELWPIEKERQQMEQQIERIIVGHFMTSTARTHAASIFIDPGDGTGPDKIIKWLSQNTPGMSVDTSKMRAGYNAGIYSVPDIVTQRQPMASSEFYEIKPDSHNGRREGRAKIVSFNRLIKDFHLGIRAGHEYDPIKSSPFPSSITIGGFVYDLELKWWQEERGLILYEICYRKRQEQEQEQTSHVGEAALILLLGIALLIMMGGRVPQTQPAGGLLGPSDGPSA
jgi:hypothetical protein